MTPLYVRHDSGHRPSGPGSKMCRDCQQRVTCPPSCATNFPPIAECNRLTSPPARRRTAREERTKCERHRPPVPPPTRPRSNSDHSLGDFWSSGRRSICSSNGHSSLSLSLSSGDASTVASTEKLWRRRKLSPRRVVTRTVTPFPAEETILNPARDAEHDILTPAPPQTTSPKPQQFVQGRRKATSFILAQKHQPIAEEQSAGKIAVNRARRKVEDCLERKPHPPSQQNIDGESNKGSERRRRKSMPDIYHRQKGDTRKADADSKKTEARVLTEIMDNVTRERIMNWLTEVAHAKDEDNASLQEALSAIDEE